MQEQKRVFLKGKMNKDLDDRIVPNGEYRDAQNVVIATSEGSDVGTVQTILGNTAQIEGITGDPIYAIPDITKIPCTYGLLRVYFKYIEILELLLQTFLFCHYSY